MYAFPLQFEQIMDQEVLKEEDLPKVRDVADGMTLYFNFVDIDRCWYRGKNPDVI